MSQGSPNLLRALGLALLMAACAAGGFWFGRREAPAGGGEDVLASHASVAGFSAGVLGALREGDVERARQLLGARMQAATLAAADLVDAGIRVEAPLVRRDVGEDMRNVRTAAEQEGLPDASRAAARVLDAVPAE